MKDRSNLGPTAEHLLVLVTLIRFLRGDARGVKDAKAGAAASVGVADGDLEAGPQGAPGTATKRYGGDINLAVIDFIEFQLQARARCV